MKNWIKINIALWAFMGVVYVLVGSFTHNALHENARKEVLQNARIIMASTSSIRLYTENEIRPLLDALIDHPFLPQSVPSYAAKQNIERYFRHNYPDYSYKEATLNPTNPMSLATKWEAELIEYFHNNKKKHELVVERVTQKGPNLYIASPIRIQNTECLSCHGKVSKAPPSMIKLYGDTHGFGWKMNEVVGSVIVGAPMRNALNRSEKILTVILFITGGAFLFIIIIFNFILFRLNMFLVDEAPVVNIVSDSSIRKANIWLLSAGWMFSGFIGAVIGYVIQRNPAYDATTRLEGRAIKITSFAVFILSLILILYRHN